MKLSIVGVPATQGNKTAFPYKGKDGKTHVALREGKSGDRHKTWRSAIVDAFNAKYPGNSFLEAGMPMDGPIVATIIFYLPRPKSAPRSRLYPDTKPDSLKLARAVEDALSRVAYTDDSRIVTHIIKKRFAIDRPPGVELELRYADDV